MSPPSPEIDSPEPHNPFQSPAVTEVEAIEPEHLEKLTLPSWRLVVGCVLVVSVILGVTWSSFPDFQLPETIGGGLILTFVVCLLIVAVTAGMGISLLVQAVRRREFSRLMPGHWRLIAFATSIVGQVVVAIVDLFAGTVKTDGLAYFLMYMPEAILAFAFYGWVLRTTQETKWWRRYAWICVVYYLSIGSEAIARWLVYQKDFMSLWNPYNVFEVAYVLAGLVAMIAFIAAMLADDRRKTKRDWYHAVGLVMPPFALFATWMMFAIIIRAD